MSNLHKYFELRERKIINKKEGIVLRAILEHPNSTLRELSKRLGFADNSRIFPWVKSLYDLDIIMTNERRKCRITHRKARIWKIKSLEIKHINKAKFKKKRYLCPQCSGRGYVIKRDAEMRLI